MGVRNPDRFVRDDSSGGGGGAITGQVALNDGVDPSLLAEVDAQGRLHVYVEGLEVIADTINLDTADIEAILAAIRDRLPALLDGDGGLKVHLQNAIVDIGTMPEVEIKNDAGSPVPVSGTVSVTEPVSVDDNEGSLTVDNPTISVVGGGSEAAAQRVTIANDSTGVVSVDDNGGSITVDGTVVAQSVLVPANYDYIDLVYTGNLLTSVVYKTGGAGGATVRTLTLAYTGDVLESVTAA